jgi:hypothetical protein
MSEVEARALAVVAAVMDNRDKAAESIADDVSGVNIGSHVE